MSAFVATIVAAALSLMPVVSAGQVRSIDPNQGIDQDLAGTARTTPPYVPLQRGASSPRTPARSTPPQSETIPADQSVSDEQDAPPPAPPAAGSPIYTPTRPSSEQARADAATEAATTYKRDDLIAAGEGVFGKGAEGLAGIIERILKDQGQPNAYIAGHEASGAFVVGLRYGSGVLSHRVEGQQPVYWTGPSVGFDVGGDAAKVFVLVYNLYDTEDLYHRFPGAEGRLYFVGGFAATYLRRGNVVVIPIRLGVGWRAGVNLNYMKFTHTSKLLPF